jgi:hypothetical protein
MRRLATLFALLALCPDCRAADAPATGAAPHAWLYGAWVGGLFPVPGSVTARQCLGQPTVIFTRDVVLRASLTDPSYAQRLVVTAQTRNGVTDFQFAPSVDPATSASRGLLAMAPQPPDGGFGCESPDVLHVARQSDNEISFPGCAAFPDPLIRCPGS